MQIIINYIITSFDSTGHCQIELRIEEITRTIVSTIRSVDN